MGQKVNPNGLRLGINRTWDSRWYAPTGEYADKLLVDLRVRKLIKQSFGQAGVTRVIIERPAKKAIVTIRAARPGVLIGKKGADIEKLKKRIMAIMGVEVQLNISEVRKPDLDPQFVAQGIAQQIERRVSYRRAMKRSIQSTIRAGAGGIRVKCSGRLAGAEIARKEEYREGRVPLHTLRADVDFAEATAHTTYGAIGVKVWIFKGEIMENDPLAQDKNFQETHANR